MNKTCLHECRTSVARGFTLIELMIVVAALAILAAIAIPSYSDYVRRAQLPEAFSTLADLRAKMEQYFQDNRNYGVSACADKTNANWKDFSHTDRFNYACVLTGGGQGFVLTASGMAGQATGHAFTIDQDGARTTTQFKGAAVSPAANCWLTRDTTC